MEKIVSTPASEEGFRKLGDGLAGATASKMFGMPCYKIGSKAFVGLYNNDAVFKLTGAAHQKALKLRGAKLFDPSGMNRPMKEWVQVPKAHAKEWPALAKAALAYVKKSVGGA